MLHIRVTCFFYANYKLKRITLRYGRFISNGRVITSIPKYCEGLKNDAQNWLCN